MPHTPAELMAQASEKVKERAQGLQKSVKHRSREGNLLRARVQGSESAPYRAWVSLEKGEWACSCPDEYNALCKHVYALLLTAQTAPESFVEGPAPRRLPNVSRWTDGDVERLLERLLEQHRPVVTDWARVVAEDRFMDEDDWM